MSQCHRRFAGQAALPLSVAAAAQRVTCYDRIKNLTLRGSVAMGLDSYTHVQVHEGEIERRPMLMSGGSWQVYPEASR